MKTEIIKPYQKNVKLTALKNFEKNVMFCKEIVTLNLQENQPVQQYEKIVIISSLRIKIKYITNI